MENITSMKWNFKKNKKAPSNLNPQSDINDVAIIGMACRFPGAENYLQYWDNLANGVNTIREISSDRWDVAQYYSPDIEAPNKSVSKWLGC